MTNTTIKNTNKENQKKSNQRQLKKETTAASTPAKKPIAKKAVKAVTKEEKTVVPMNPPKDIIATDVYNKEIITELKRRSNFIRIEMNKVENSFSRIAFNLYWIYNNKSFKALGYDNIYDLAKNEFNIARGTTSNFINIVERFGKKEDGQFVETIDDCYKGFKSSQLIVMLGMDEEELKKVNADMSVSDIKKLKSNSEAETENTTSSDENSNETEGKVIDVESSEVVDNRTVMIEIKDLDDYYKHRDMMETQIIRALSVRGKSYKVEISYTW